MAPGKTAVDFNTIINADRQRRKNEALAQQIFSKGRRSSAPGAGINTRKPGTGPSLASRVGVAKRTVSTSQKNARPNVRPSAGNVDAEWTHDLHSLNNPLSSRVSQAPHRAPNTSRAKRNERIYSVLNGSASSPAINKQFNVVGSARPSTGITIKGLAGPYIVMAKNFALGTTAADIESAMTPVGGVCLSCRIVSERPNLIAEIIFESKEGADNVVDTFNNQNADGNLLHVYHKVGGVVPTKQLKPQSASAASASRPLTPLGPRADIINERPDETRLGYNSSDRYAPRNRSRERRREYDPRDEIVDGSYGFEDRMETDDRAENSGRGRGGLYSDDLLGNRGRGRGNSRDRGRGNDHSHGYR